MRYAQETDREQDVQRENEKEAERCVDQEGVERVGDCGGGEVVD